MMTSPITTQLTEEDLKRIEELVPIAVFANDVKQLIAEVRRLKEERDLACAEAATACGVIRRHIERGGDFGPDNKAVLMIVDGSSAHSFLAHVDKTIAGLKARVAEAEELISDNLAGGGDGMHRNDCRCLWHKAARKFVDSP